MGWAVAVLFAAPAFVVPASVFAGAGPVADAALLADDAAVAAVEVAPDVAHPIEKKSAISGEIKIRLECLHFTFAVIEGDLELLSGFQLGSTSNHLTIRQRIANNGISTFQNA